MKINTHRISIQVLIQQNSSNEVIYRTVIQQQINTINDHYLKIPQLISPKSYNQQQIKKTPYLLIITFKTYNQNQQKNSMGNTHSSTPPINNFNPTQWQYLTQPPNPRILANRKNNNHFLEQHSILITDNQTLEKAQELYQMRNNDPELVSSSYIIIDIYQQICSKFYYGSIFTQHIPLRLSNIVSIPFPDILHLYSQCFNGFHRLAKQLGYFIVHENSIGINQHNVVKVWISSNLGEITPHSPIQYQWDMVRNIVQLIESNTNSSTMPTEQPSFIHFLYKDTPRIRFQQAKLKLQHYSINYNKGIIPTHLSCIIKPCITINQSNNFIQANHLTCSNQTLINTNQYQGQYLGRQKSKTLLHCSSGQSLSTVDASTQTNATVNQIWKIKNKIGNNASNPKYNPSNQLTKSTIFHHLKSKPQLSINFLSHPLPTHPILTPTINKPNILISSPKINLSPTPSPTFSLNRSQSQSKLNYPNSKLQSQPMLIKSGTLKMLNINNYVSIGNMYQQGKKINSNQNINIQKISKNKIKTILNGNQLINNNQFPITNPINQHKTTKNTNNIIDLHPKNLNPKSPTQIPIKLSQPTSPPRLLSTTPQIPQIPPLHFDSLNINQRQNPPSFRYPLSSQRRSRQEQLVLASSRTNHSNSMSSVQKNIINKSINQLSDNQHSIHHNQPSSNLNPNTTSSFPPPPSPSQNPQSPNKQPQGHLSPITTQAPTSTCTTSTFMKYNQQLLSTSTQLTPYINHATFGIGQSINPAMEINNIKSKLTLSPQFNDQVSMISSEQFIIFNNSRQKDCSDQFTISPNPHTPLDNQYKIQSPSNLDPQFQVNQSISTITNRPDHDTSNSYLPMQWQHQGGDGDYHHHHPESTKNLACYQIDQIHPQNICDTSWEFKYKDKNTRNIYGDMIGQGHYDNYSFRKNTNGCNNIQSTSSRGNNSSFSCPKTNSKPYLSPSNYPSPKYDIGGPTPSYTPTYSITTTTNNNPIQIPKPSKPTQIAPSNLNHEKTIIDSLSFQKQFQPKSSLTDNLPYNVQWDPQILADLKANMLLT